MRLYFGLTMAALGFAAVSGAAMAWDGSYVLFKILDLQSPFPAHGRFVNIPLHWIVLLVSRFTSDLNILQAVFGLVYASIPLIALVISWWVVRGHAETLFIWAALSIGLGTLPGQFCFVCEALYVISLFWPILLSILTRMRKHKVPVILLFIMATFFAHFISSILFAFGACLAFAIGLRSRDDRCWIWMWAFGLSAMAVSKFLMFWIFPSAYEMSVLSIDVLMYYFMVSVAGLPLLFILCIWVSGFMSFFSGILSTSLDRKLLSFIHAIELISLITAGGLLLIWARDPHLWAYAVSFRGWALFASFPFMMLAAFEALTRLNNYSYNEKNEWNRRIKPVQIIGVIFSLVIFVQSTSWFNLTNILRDTLAQSAYGCISVSSIDFITGTPLDNWSTPSYSVLLQGRAPQKLVLSGNGCTEAGFSEAVRLAPWELRSRTGGWFDLRLSGLLPSQGP